MKFGSSSLVQIKQPNLDLDRQFLLFHLSVFIHILFPLN